MIAINGYQKHAGFARKQQLLHSNFLNCLLLKTPVRNFNLGIAAAISQQASPSSCKATLSPEEHVIMTTQHNAANMGVKIGCILAERQTFETHCFQAGGISSLASEVSATQLIDHGAPQVAMSCLKYSMNLKNCTNCCIYKIGVRLMYDLRSLSTNTVNGDWYRLRV